MEMREYLPDIREGCSSPCLPEARGEECWQARRGMQRAVRAQRRRARGAAKGAGVRVQCWYGSATRQRAGGVRVRCNSRPSRLRLFYRLRKAFVTLA